MKKNILKYSLSGLVVLAGFFSWFSVYNAPKITGVSAWYIAILFFSFYIIAMCLAAILIRQEIFMELIIAASFLLSLIFAFSLEHFVILIFGILLMLGALRDIRKDLDLNIKVDVWKSLYTGKFKMILALALIISSQYFFMISNVDEQKVVPKLDLSPITSKLIEPILSMMNPNFKAMQAAGLTVDQFIVQSQQGNGSDFSSDQAFSEEIINRQIPEDLPVEQRTALKEQAMQQISDSRAQLSQKNNELVLQEGRSQLSQMTGHTIDGNEKIADVFVGLIDKKINDFFQPKVGGDSQSAFYSYIIAAILLLTIWPLGSILSLLWFGIVIIIFKIFVHFELVEIKTVTVQREMIV